MTGIMKNFTYLPVNLAFMIVLQSSYSNDGIYNNIVQLKYGNSFGKCIGYCKHDITIKSTMATYTCSGWAPTVQTLTKTDSIKNSTLDSLCRFNTNSFFNLAETIGCPDCADGGAEWFEIVLTNGKIHRVTFEYYNEPANIKEQIILLRKILNKNVCN